MTKQTAVEWLLQQMDLQTISKYDKQLVQAKEMEKEQIIDAYKFGNLSDVYFKPEQYYNETYGGTNE
jgi:hypothetical protein